jgi:hypothetical protein
MPMPRMNRSNTFSLAAVLAVALCSVPLCGGYLGTDGTFTSFCFGLVA